MAEHQETVEVELIGGPLDGTVMRVPARRVWLNFNTGAAMLAWYQEDSPWPREKTVPYKYRFIGWSV